jgi:hypothetical protein
MEGPHCSFRPDSLTNMAAIGDSCFNKAYNHKHELPVAAMFVNGSGQNEQPL